MNTTEKKEFLKKLIQEDDAALAITLQNFRENHRRVAARLRG